MKYPFFARISANLRAWGQTPLLAAGLLLMASAWNQSLAQTAGAGAVDQGTAAKNAGEIVAQHQSNPADLPQSVRNAVITAAAQQTGIPPSQFQVVEAEQRDWPDGCLGIAAPGTACTQVIVTGWQVVVQANQQEWIFRTDGTGDQVKLADSRAGSGNNPGYTDLQGHWAESCIQRLSQQGTISGYPDNTFRPNSSITRAEYAALLNQAFPDVQPQRGGNNFSDVPDGFWGQEAIQTAYRKGFLSGYPNQEFRPNQLVNRAETYVALASGLNYGPPDNGSAILTSAYGDAAAIPAYATEEIAALTQQGAIVKSASGATNFNPAEPATRAQVAATLCQLKFEDATLPQGYVVTPVEDPGNVITLSQTCTNQAAGYTVNYPTGWQTNPGEVLNVCQVFDPASITLPERSSSFDEAIHLRIDSIPFERATGGDNITETILSRRTTTVDGYEAVVEESESTGRALLPSGVRSYTYVINIGDGEIMVASTYEVANQPYLRNKQVLDQMINSLRFNR